MCLGLKINAVRYLDTLSIKNKRLRSSQVVSLFFSLIMLDLIQSYSSRPSWTYVSESLRTFTLQFYFVIMWCSCVWPSKTIIERAAIEFGRRGRECCSRNNWKHFICRVSIEWELFLNINGHSFWIIWIKNILKFLNVFLLNNPRRSLALSLGRVFFTLSQNVTNEQFFY